MRVLALDGVSGTAAPLSEDRWLAGLDAHAGEVEASAGAGESRLNQIEFARGNAAGDEQQIGLGSLCERGVEGLGCVSRDGQTPMARRRLRPPSRPAWERSSCGSGRDRARTGWAQVRRRWREWPRAGERRPGAPRNRRSLRALSAPAPIAVPAGSSSSPLRACAPRATMFSPFSMVRGGSSRTVRADGPPPVSTCSSIITASAPAGTGAPVMISHAAPRGSGPDGACPARVEPATASGRCARGLRSPAGEAVAGGARKGRLVAVGTERLRQHPPGCPRKRDALHRGPEPRPLRGVCRHQRRRLVKTQQIGAGQSRTPAMNCRGLGQARSGCFRTSTLPAAKKITCFRQEGRPPRYGEQARRTPFHHPNRRPV